MIVLEGVTLPFPNSFSWEPQPISGKQGTMAGGNTRGNKGLKETVQLGWTTMTKTERDVLLALYDLQRSNFQTLTFLFENAKMNQDIGPIEVFMSIGGLGLGDNGRYYINITLRQR